jgi:hypothetical protein
MSAQASIIGGWLLPFKHCNVQEGVNITTAAFNNFLAQLQYNKHVVATAAPSCATQ